MEKQADGGIGALMDHFAAQIRDQSSSLILAFNLYCILISY